MTTTLAIRKELSPHGKQKPYFAITADIHEDGRLVAFGCMHEEILLRHPELADFVAHHLSDIDGVPMHAIENGWYWLASTFSPATFGAAPTHPDSDEAFDFFCKHCRITPAEGAAIRVRVYHSATAASTEEFAATAKAKWVGICEAMKPRWKAEADAVIRKYNLKVVKED